MSHDIADTPPNERSEIMRDFDLDPPMDLRPAFAEDPDTPCWQETIGGLTDQIPHVLDELTAPRCPVCQQPDGQHRMDCRSTEPERAAEPDDAAESASNVDDTHADPAPNDQ